MTAFFCDSSAIVKRYMNERGSVYVDGIADAKSGNLILLSRITRVEVAAAIARRLKAGSLNAADAQKALAMFQHDVTNNYFTIEVAPNLLSEAIHLATKHALRGYDAVQLASALDANNERASIGLFPLTLVSADTDLNNAAQVENLNVENPNNHP